MQEKFVRIVSNGLESGTYVLDPNTGMVIPGVLDIKWELNSRASLAKATVKLYATVEATAMLDALPMARPVAYDWGGPDIWWWIDR